MDAADVAVYGATAGGVVAAIAASEAGARCVLLEPGRHVGGMVTGGLGKTDHERQERVIGGHARTFFERVGATYSEPIAWRFEPHVAEQILLDWLDRAGVDVRHDWALDAVASSGGAMTTVTSTAGASVTAGVWVDATYEGDLLAAAGVSYRVGREARSLHGESLAGRRELLPGPHQFRAPVRAADAMALAALVQPLEAIGLPGDGDGKLQGYGYRVCLSGDRGRSEPLAPPAGYDPAHYRLVAAYLRALGDGARVGDVLGVGQLPNGKADVNSNGPVSTNLLGASWGYPEATAVEREQIRARHHDWDQGLLYFLASDPAVLVHTRSALGRWGLPHDEFTDSGGWPHQLYVREARRMVGEYVLTQRDLTAERGKPDGIGMGGYNVDIREVQWVACPVSRFPDVVDELLTEGYLSVPVEPWQIPYRALLPRREECTNLLVPVCISASHVAFNGFRLEPQYMIAGQAAGTAAALAARDAGGRVHDVDIEELQRRLVASGAILSFP